MSDELLKKLSDHELRDLVLRAQQEIALRARQHKEDTIAKIKELAGAGGLSVAIKGTRGRPPKRAGQGAASRTLREK